MSCYHVIMSTDAVRTNVATSALPDSPLVEELPVSEMIVSLRRGLRHLVSFLTRRQLPSGIDPGDVDKFDHATP